jgi:hypothetical protein
VHSPAGDAEKRGNVAVQVQQGVHLDDRKRAGLSWNRRRRSTGRSRWVDRPDVAGHAFCTQPHAETFPLTTSCQYRAAMAA